MKRYTDLSGTLENGLWGYDVLPGLENILGTSKKSAFGCFSEAVRKAWFNDGLRYYNGDVFMHCGHLKRFFERPFLISIFFSGGWNG